MMASIVKSLQIEKQQDAVVVFDQAMQTAFEAKHFKKVAVSTPISDAVLKLIQTQ